MLFYKLTGCKKAAFFYKRYCCKKAAFLCKNPAFSHIQMFGEKRASCSSFRPFDKPIYRRQAISYSMVWTLLNCSFRALLKPYVIRYPAVVTFTCSLYCGAFKFPCYSLTALKLYVLFILFIISSRFLCRSIFQDLLTVGCEEGTGSNFICYAYRPKSRTTVTAC